MLKKLISEIWDIDVLIIGAGAAGLRAAIEADRYGAKVAIVCKGVFRRCGVTLMAGASYQAAFGFADPRDGPDVHFRDTVVGGCYVVNQKLAEVFAQEAPHRAIELRNWGVNFSEAGGKFFQMTGPGQTYPRTLLCESPHAGVRYINALANEVERRNIRIFDELFVTRLFTFDNTVVGVAGLDIKEGQFEVFQTKSVVLATGGGMSIYPITTASKDATGDGYALAHDAGAELVDMEFVQFGPFALYWPECFQGRGWPADIRYSKMLHKHYFLNGLGQRFMDHYDPKRREWATRDVISRAMALEAREGRGAPHGGVYLSIRHLPEDLIAEFIKTRSSLVAKLKSVGLDIKKDDLEVGPAAHYFMGGVRIDERCQSSIFGLYVAGECSGGLDGANRLDHNAIPWTQVSAVIAGRNAAEYAKAKKLSNPCQTEIKEEYERVFSPLMSKEGKRPSEIQKALCDTVSNSIFVIRSGNELRKSKAHLDAIKKDIVSVMVTTKTNRYNKELVQALELFNMVTTAEMILISSTLRTESRGSHFRIDYPKTDNRDWLKNIVLKSAGGNTVPEIVPPVITKIWPDQ